jgi:hypothetical protein
VGLILSFLRGHVFVHEDYFASHKYNRHRCLRDYSNTPLEGTNGGLKYGYFAVQPHMKISTSASYMICQDEHRHAEQKRTAHVNSCNTRLYNLHVKGSKETTRIVPKAVGEMQRQIELADTYFSLQTDDSAWLVRTGKGDGINVETRLIPIFRRVRKVKRFDHGGFECTCTYTPMYGIPCRHIAHVIQCYCTEEYLFNHHDVDVRWWTAYADFVVLKSPSSLNHAELEIRERLLETKRTFKLRIGREAKMKKFQVETIVYGPGVEMDSLASLPMGSAKEMFFDVASYPRNYNQEQVDHAVFHLNNTYGGIKMIYGGENEDVSNMDNASGDNGDDGGDNDDNGGDDDDDNGGDDDYDGGDDDIGGGNDNVGDNYNNGDIGDSDDNTGIVIDDCGDKSMPSVGIDFSRRNVAEQENGGAAGPRYLEMLGTIKELFSFMENCDDDFYAKYKEEIEDQVCRARRNVISHRKKKDQGMLISCKPTNIKNTERKHRKQHVNY